MPIIEIKRVRIARKLVDNDPFLAEIFGLYGGVRTIKADNSDDSSIITIDYAELAAAQALSKDCETNAFQLGSKSNTAVIYKDFKSEETQESEIADVTISPDGIISLKTSTYSKLGRDLLEEFESVAPPEKPRKNLFMMMTLLTKMRLMKKLKNMMLALHGKNTLTMMKKNSGRCMMISSCHLLHTL